MVRPCDEQPCSSDGVEQLAGDRPCCVLIRLNCSLGKDQLDPSQQTSAESTRTPTVYFRSINVDLDKRSLGDQNITALKFRAAPLRASSLRCSLGASTPLHTYPH